MPLFARTVILGFQPFPSDGSTDFDPVLEVWTDAGRVVNNFVRHDGVSVTFDVSNVLEALESAKRLEVGSDTRATDSVIRRWLEKGYAAHLEFLLESEVELAPDVVYRIVHSTVQHLFLAQCLCARGAGYFNRARRLDEEDAESEEGAMGAMGYYGDPLEFAWSEAKEWGYPPLIGIPFAAAWNWLIQSEFDKCSIARTPLHKTLSVLLALSRQFSRVAAADVLALAQALEALLGGGSEKIGATLRARVEMILGEPVTHKRWLTDFYGLRSRIVHGAFPILRPGGFVEEEELERHEHELLRTIDRAIAVVLCLLQKLVVANATGFRFSETFTYES
jgi:hypothetical protein